MTQEENGATRIRKEPFLWRSRGDVIMISHQDLFRTEWRRRVLSNHCNFKCTHPRLLGPTWTTMYQDVAAAAKTQSNPHLTIVALLRVAGTPSQERRWGGGEGVRTPQQLTHWRLTSSYAQGLSSKLIITGRLKTLIPRSLISVVALCANKEPLLVSRVHWTNSILNKSHVTPTKRGKITRGPCNVSMKRGKSALVIRVCVFMMSIG